MINHEPKEENTMPETVVIYCRAATKESAERKKREMKRKAEYLGAAVKSVFVDVIPARTEWEKAQKYCKKHNIDNILMQKSEKPNETVRGYTRMTEREKILSAPEIFPAVTYADMRKLVTERKAGK